MRKTWLIFFNELTYIFTRRGYLLLLIIVPVTWTVVMLLTTALKSNPQNMVSEIFEAPTKPVVEGYLDEGGFIKSLPDWMVPSRYIAYPSRSEAMQALQNKQVEGIYIVSDGYPTLNQVEYLRADNSPLKMAVLPPVFDLVLKYNLLAGDGVSGDQAFASTFTHPVLVDKVSLAPPSTLTINRQSKDILLPMLLICSSFRSWAAHR